MASLFTERAITYRQTKGFDHFSVGVSVGVQKMIRSDLACSGVMFSIDTETGFKNSIVINAGWGLGENIVQGILEQTKTESNLFFFIYGTTLGTINPDEFYVFKPTLDDSKYKPIIQKKLGQKEMTMLYKKDKTGGTKNVTTAANDRQKFCLTDDEGYFLFIFDILLI
jgi:pyruvate,water dikinase